jgi:pimeloyl-ACP methyl ester carboxylesterase
MTETFRRVVAISVALITAAVSVQSVGGDVDAAPVSSRVIWSPCFKDVQALTGVGYECSVVQVPLDYDAPMGSAIQLSLIRMPATDPANKIGSIFLNPGGPGGSGVEFALFFGPFVESVWGPEVRAHFDIIGFDPRGVGRSTTLKCFGNVNQSVQVFAPFYFPMTPEEEQLVQQGDALLAGMCDQRSNKIVDHMSTANVARDLDRLRAAVGDDALNFVGLSYGSFLGNTYANMFPDNVRAVVIDGVLDPIAWANLEAEIPFSTRLRSDEGAQQTLERLFDMCDDAGPSDCAFAPSSRDRFAALAERLLTEPALVTDPETGEQFVIRYSDLIGITAGSLYDPFSYEFLAQVLAAIESSPPASVGAALQRLNVATGLGSKRGFPTYQNFVEAFPAVACEDGNNPTDYAIWSEQGAAADAEFGYFGRYWTWASSPCAQWPFADTDRYTGPFNADPANPVLVIGNLYDPATRYQGAVTVDGLLQNSALLTVDVPGHTSLGLSSCAGALTGQYLLDPSAAGDIDGDKCPADFENYFEVESAAATGSALMVSLRHQLLQLLA